MRTREDLFSFSVWSEYSVVKIYSVVNHGTHRTHGMKTRAWGLGRTYSLFPCGPSIPW